jgi:hypothetical protein
MLRAIRMKAIRACKGMGNWGMYSTEQGTGGLQARVKRSGKRCSIRCRVLMLPPMRERVRA